MTGPIGVLADLHCGSRFGLTPPRWWYKSTPEAVKWMYERYLMMVRAWPPLQLLIWDGDLIQGKGERSKAVGLISASLEEQVDIAIACADVWRKKVKKMIRIDGTGAHETFEGPLGKFDVTFGIKRPTDYRKFQGRDIYLGQGTILHVKHAPEGGRTLYRGTALNRELIQAVMAETCQHIPDANFLIRAHLHSEGTMRIRRMGKQIDMVPCLCLQQPYALDQHWYGWIPDLGGTLIYKDRNAFYGWRVEATVFETPALEAERYGQI